MRGRRLDWRLFCSTLGLCIAQGICPAKAHVHFTDCKASDCIWLVVDESLRASKSLSKADRAAGKHLTLQFPRMLEGPSPGQGIGLVDPRFGTLRDVVYFDKSDGNVVFQPAQEIPKGISLIRAVPETGDPQLVFTVPTADGALSRI